MCAAAISDRISRGGISRAEGRGGKYSGDCDYRTEYGRETVAIKTVALACLMAQCGLHVTCGKASLCMRSNYLCDIGDGQSLSENLSTFSAHIVNVLDIQKNISPDSLVILE